MGEKKINNTKHYKLITIQHLSISEKNYEIQKPHVKNCLINASKQFFNYALERDHKLDMLFKNAQISSLDYSVSIDSENTTYFISSDKTYVFRFFGSNFFVYHMSTGKGFLMNWITWTFSTNPRMHNFKQVTQIGEFLPSCHHLKVKQVIFEKKIKNNVVSKQDNISIRFHLNCEGLPKSPGLFYVFCRQFVYRFIYLNKSI